MIDPKVLITHHFTLDQMMDAEYTFADTADTDAFTLVIEL